MNSRFHFSFTSMVFSSRTSAEEAPNMMLRRPGSTTKLCLPAAQHDVEAAGFYYEAVFAGVPASQIRPFQWQPDGPRLVGPERDPRESAKFLDGPLDRGIEMLDVHLDHLIAGPRPRVFDVHTDHRFAGGVDRFGRRAQVGILERGVTQAESERIQGLP